MVGGLEGRRILTFVRVGEHRVVRQRERLRCRSVWSERERFRRSGCPYRDPFSGTGSCEEIAECTHTVIVTYTLILYSAGMSTLPAPLLPRLASIDRSQLLLHTLDVERLIDEGHSARSIWHLVGRMNLSLYHAKIAALEGRAGRNHTAPQLLISLWLYAYSQGISSAREIARQCAFEPGFAWLCGLQPISHRTLSGFRSDHKEALENLFVQVVGMLSAEGLITMQRVTLDGTKIKANASGNTFRRKEKIEAHLAWAREQVQKMNEQAAEEEKAAKRQSAAKRRAARQRVSRLEASSSICLARIEIFTASRRTNHYPVAAHV
jgi:transposase